MKKIFLFVLVFVVNLAYSDTSIIIGSNDMVEVASLDPASSEALLARNVGVLRHENTKCSGFVYEGRAFTARHCVDGKHHQAQLCLGLDSKPCLTLDFTLAPNGLDLAYANRVYLGVPELSVKKAAFLLHQQGGELLLSPNCEYWQVTPNNVYHTCDSNFGSSGGMLVDVETNKPVAVHTGGIPQLNVNTGVLLEVLGND